MYSNYFQYIFLFFFWHISDLSRENAFSFTNVIFNISVIMAVALVPDQAIFDHISLVRIGAHFMDDCQECIKWCRQYGLLAMQMVSPTCYCHCREQALDRAVDSVTWRCPVKACKKRFSIRQGSFFEKSHLQLWQLLDLNYLWCGSAGKSRGVSDVTQTAPRAKPTIFTSYATFFFSFSLYIQILNLWFVFFFIFFCFFNYGFNFLRRLRTKNFL